MFSYISSGLVVHSYRKSKETWSMQGHQMSTRSLCQQEEERYWQRNGNGYKNSTTLSSWPGAPVWTNKHTWRRWLTPTAQRLKNKPLNQILSKTGKRTSVCVYVDIANWLCILYLTAAVTHSTYHATHHPVCHLPGVSCCTPHICCSKLIAKIVARRDSITRKCRTLWGQAWASWYRNIMSLMRDVASTC